MTAATDFDTFMRRAHFINTEHLEQERFTTVTIHRGEIRTMPATFERIIHEIDHPGHRLDTVGRYKKSRRRARANHRKEAA